MTTDQDLIKDGVQSIPDEFLQFFVKNPNCEHVQIEIDYNKFKKGNLPISKCYEIIISKKEQCICKVGHPYNNACCKIHGNIPEEDIKQEEFELVSIGEERIKLSIQDTKQETFEEAAEKEYPFAFGGIGNSENDKKNHFIKGAKWQAERMYSEEDMRSAFFNGGNMKSIEEFQYWFEQFKKKQ